MPKRCFHSNSSSSPIAKSVPRSVANTDSSSSGHSMAASAERMASTSSRSWNVRPPTSTCADAARLQRADVWLRHVLTKADEAPEQQADMTRRPHAPARSPLRSVTIHPLSLTSQSTNAAVASGSERSISLLDTFRSRTGLAGPAARPPTAVVAKPTGAAGAERSSPATWRRRRS